MAGSQLLPLKVSAKVLKAPVKVPKLDGAVFNRDQNLKPGIHIHWALPDELIQAKVDTGEKKERAFFPGVPDLWLVFRLNPIPTNSGKWTWRAWVVDSIEETVTPLDDWEPPLDRNPQMIHTAAGLLPHAAELGHKAYGVWDSGRGTFDPLAIAYYPACRTRFGFYDDLEGLEEQGNDRLHYTVIGWYSLREHDAPYHQWLHRWKFKKGNRKQGPNALAQPYMEMRAPVHPDLISREAAWMDAPINSETTDRPARAVLSDVKRIAGRGGSLNEQLRKVESLQAAFPQPSPGANAPSYQTVQNAVKESGWHETLCHGTVFYVPLGGADTAPGALKSEDIHLFPNIKRALADIVTKNPSEGNDVEHVEMLLQNLDGLNGSVPGVLDLPGAAHMLSFQNVPGKSRFYARLDIYPPLKKGILGPTYMSVQKSPFTKEREGSGYFPPMQRHLASDKSFEETPGLNIVGKAPIATSTPQEPDEEEIREWITALTESFESVRSAAENAGTPIHERLIYVHDNRANAQPLNLPRSADGKGTDGAGWWLDMADLDPQSLKVAKELFVSVYGARVQLPSVDNLFEQPGARWYRPWSPQLVLYGTGRSYKFGFDGRFRADQRVTHRHSGEVVAGLSVGEGEGAPVYADDIIDEVSKLSVAGLPMETRALVGESALLNPGSAAILTNRSVSNLATTEVREKVQRQFVAVIQGIHLRRDPKHNPKIDQLLSDKVYPFGRRATVEGMMWWNDPRDPMFVDVNYAHPRSSLEVDWQLKQDHVDSTPLSPEETNPPSGQVEVFEERTPFSSTVTQVLESALITATTLDTDGAEVRAYTLPEGLEEDTFQKLDVISAPLKAFDTELFNRGYRERSGALRVNKLDLVDVFGLTRHWNSGIVDEASPEGGPHLPYWTELTPRLPYWSRVNFRLQSAIDSDKEATPIDPAVCGLLLPDFLEHAMEVFDASGKAIGQLKTDRARFGGAGQTLQVSFELHPWVAKEKQIPEGGNPLAAIENTTLRSLVESLLDQQTVIPQNALPDSFSETGLTAMMRVIDTIRGTLDPSVKTADRRVRMLGEPIAIWRARLRFECSSARPFDLTQGSPLLSVPPEIPKIPVRIGDITRPDDGVLGVFIPGATPAQGRFAPVSVEARTEAILDGFRQETPWDFNQPYQVEHEFISQQESKFQIVHDQPMDVIILSDLRGSLYATFGVSPRKKIKIPKEFLTAALANMEPTFRTGPIMTVVRNDSLRPLLSPPDIEGHVAEYVYSREEAEGAEASFAETPLPPAPPIAELPPGRAMLHEGWIRVFRRKS